MTELKFNWIYQSFPLTRRIKITLCNRPLFSQIFVGASRRSRDRRRHRRCRVTGPCGKKPPLVFFLPSSPDARISRFASSQKLRTNWRTGDADGCRSFVSLRVERARSLGRDCAQKDARGTQKREREKGKEREREREREREKEWEKWD